MTKQEIDNLKQRILGFDWSYMMSDDHRVWKKGEAIKSEIIKDLMDLTAEESEAFLAWWANNMGEDPYKFKTWVTAVLKKN